MKKLFALLLLVCMIVTFVPVPAIAENEQNIEPFEQVDETDTYQQEICPESEQDANPIDPAEGDAGLIDPIRIDPTEGDADPIDPIRIDPMDETLEEQNEAFEADEGLGNSPGVYLDYDEGAQTFVQREIPADAIRFSTLGQVNEIGAYQTQTCYVLDCDYIYRETSLYIKGDVSLILMDDCRMEVFSVRVDYPFSIRIYSQANGTGTLIADNSWHSYGHGENGCAGIGASSFGIRDSVYDYNSGDIYIYGGNITAKGGPKAAGIGGSGMLKNNASAGRITIRGGVINATGGTGGTGGTGAGIGGGSDGNATNITISGGIITARSIARIDRHCAAAIGCGGDSYLFSGGTGGKFENITISGGIITAETSGFGAGIGGGYKTDRGARNIIITGGHITVNADAGRFGYDEECAAGIGGGYKSFGINISISGSDTEITAIGATDTAIGCSGGTANITIDNTFRCFAGSNINDLTRRSDPVNAVSTNKAAKVLIDDPYREIVYSDADGQNRTHQGYCELNTMLSRDELCNWNSQNNPTKWYVVKDSLSILDGVTISGGDYTLVLADGCELNLPHLTVNGLCSLTIYAQTAQSGKLNCVDTISNENAINVYSGGSLTINGGKISVRAMHGSAFSIQNSELIINRGEITPTSDNDRVFFSFDGKLTFNGGNITLDKAYTFMFYLVRGEWNINGGKITLSCLNRDLIYAYGTKVSMTGGELSANTARSCVIFLKNDGKFTMTGGKFSASTSLRPVIDMESGELKLVGGEFSASTTDSPVLNKQDGYTTVNSDLVCYAGSTMDNLMLYPSAPVHSLYTYNAVILSDSFEEIAYTDFFGSDQTNPGYCTLDAGLSRDELCNWNSQNSPTRWYAVKGHLDIPDEITVSGYVTLVLADDCELNALQGLRVGENSMLTIYGQSAQSGKLSTAGNVIERGLIAVNGGKVTAQSSDVPTFDVNEGSLMINRGEVSANSSGASVIDADQGTVLINGGKFSARSTGAPIFDIDGGEFTIIGGEITASSTSSPVLNNRGANITVSRSLQCYAGSNMDDLTYHSNPADALCTNSAVQLRSSDADSDYDSHTHSFRYTASGNQITAICSASDCPYPENRITLTLNAPKNLSYDGGAKEVSFTNGEAEEWKAATGNDAPRISYTADWGSRLTGGKAVNAGSYTANITVNGKKASLKFTVTKAEYADVTKTVSGELNAAKNSKITLSLPALPRGASYGRLLKTGRNERYTLSPIIGNRITVTSAGIPEGTGTLTFTVPVTGDSNHNGYTVTVTVNVIRPEVNPTVDMSKSSRKTLLGISVPTYTASVTADSDDVRIVRVEYSLLGLIYTVGNKIDSLLPIGHFFVRITDSNGDRYVYEYLSGRFIER